jgi:ribosomal protein S10
VSASTTTKKKQSQTSNKPQQKIRIRLKSFDHRSLDAATVKIVNTAEK